MSSSDSINNIIRGQYYPHIDGLRAFAVTSVLLYHAFPSMCPGGYIGVDVFFVISGYLITKGLLNDLDGNRFSIGTFYVRRIRRIFPAYLAVIIFSLVMGVLFFYGQNLQVLSKTAYKSSFFLTNIHFAKSSGYFSPDSHNNPLLNLWSLSVEEQFYIFFPLILAALYKWWRAHLKLILWLLFFISLVLNIYMVNISNNATNAFYWLPYRAWELLAGCLLAIYMRDNFLVKKGALTALVILCTSFYYCSNQLPFPGLVAMVPVLCAVVLLACGNYKTVQPIMESRLAVFLGKISYSLYLFHWPMLVFCRHLFNRQLSETTTGCIAVLLSVVLSIISWKYIETPMRCTRWVNKKYYIFGVSVLLFTICLSQVTRHIAKYEIKHPVVFVEEYWNGNPVSIEKYPDPVWEQCENFTPNTFTTLGEDKNYQYVLWGDSHAMALAPGLHAFSQAIGVNGIYINRKHTLLYDTYSDAYPNNAEWIDTVLAWLECHKDLHTVILVNRWAVRAEGSMNENGSIVKYYRRDKTTGNSFQIFRLGLTQLCQKLRDIGKNVVILSSVPEQEINVPESMFKGILGIRNINCISQESFRKRQGAVDKVLVDLEAANLAKIIRIDSIFYKDNNPIPLLLPNTTSMYTDDDHLSPSGARFLMEKIKLPLFSAISNK